MLLDWDVTQGSTYWLLLISSTPLLLIALVTLGEYFVGPMMTAYYPSLGGLLVSASYTPLT